MAVRKIIPRSTWGASPPKSTPSKVSWHKGIEVWVHHSEYFTLGIGENRNNEYKRMQEIQNLHQRAKPAGRGWSDIGYHYIIMPSGRIYEGRGKGVIGSHCSGQNSEPGICFDGKYDSDLPSSEALQSFSWLLDHLNLGKNNLKGHRNGFVTSCPGDALYNHLIRDKKVSDWEAGGDDSDNTDDGPRDVSGYTFPKGLPGNSIKRIVPTPTDDPFSPFLLSNKKDYYNTLDPDLKKGTTSKYLAADAYFSGGRYNSGNMCSFQYVRKTPSGNQTKTIHLIVPPNSISWTYSLRTKIEDTYGGQVIQILGVQIDNFKLSGYIPDGFWGRDNNYYDKSDGIPYFEDKENARKNGIVHLANFFRDFFAYKSQNSFSTENMQFHYPHYGWTGEEKSIKIIPYDFPRVRIANDEILPEWELECSLVEYLSSHFVSQATKTATNQLQYLKSGIGFIDFIQWSDPTATSDISVSEQARSLGASYAEFVNNFEISEVDTLSQAGFSYPPDIIDKTVTTEVQKVIQDRFGTSV
jgi:hypothetical protein